MATPRPRSHFVIALIASFIESLKRDMVGEAGAVTDPQHDHGGATGAGASHNHAFTGTAPTSAVTNATTGTGFATVGQVVTTTETFTAAENQYADHWLITATQPPCLIVSHPAAAGAPLALTVIGTAPPTAAEAFRILRAPTPAGTNAAESTHTHSIAAGATGISVAGGGTAVHYDQAEYPVTTPNASDLDSAIALAQALVYAYLRHVADTLAHAAADTTNDLDDSDAAKIAATIVDLSSTSAVANVLKRDLNAHRAQSGVHPTNDSGHAITSPDATDQGSLNTLLNELKSDLNAHMAAGLSTPSWRVES